MNQSLRITFYPYVCFLFPLENSGKASEVQVSTRAGDALFFANPRSK